MFCRNCANELDDKATACLKCGCNPYSEKKFCSSCGVETNANQVICTKCGISFDEKLKEVSNANSKNIDVTAILKNPTIIFAFIALIGCFIPWLSMKTGFMSMGFSVFNLGLPLMASKTILVGGLLFFIPLCLVGIIIGQFMPQIAKFNPLFFGLAILLLVYAAFGFYQLKNPGSSGIGGYDSGYGIGNLGGLSDSFAQLYSIGFGLYITAGATLICFFVSGIFTKSK